MMNNLYTALVVLIVVAAIYFLHRRSKDTTGSVNPLENPAFITAVLKRAAEQHVYMTVVNASPEAAQLSLYGLCQKQEQNDIIGILATGENLASTWQDTPVNAYFHFESRGSKTFYHFSGWVHNVVQHEEANILQLAIPDLLTHKQRRDFTRVSPLADMVEAITLWTIPEDSELPTSFQSMGQPHFTYRLPKLAQVVLMDVSAGGALVRLSPLRLEELQHNFTIGDRIIALAAFKDFKVGRVLFLWLDTVCRRAVTNKYTGHVELSLQFTQWAAPNDLQSTVEWLPVESNGDIPLLLDWIRAVLPKLQHI